MAKEKIICDTDVMIDYWDKTNIRHAATKVTLENAIQLDNVVLSAITKMELMLGATNKTDLQKITRKLTRFNIALINNDITLRGFDLIETYRLSHGLALADSLIAATVLLCAIEVTTRRKNYQ